MKKKIVFTVGIILLILLVIGSIIFNSWNSNFIKLDYEQIMAKIENKENFVLCISAKDCTHCRSYKPKLRKIANDYKINIFYVDIDALSKEDYDNFKEKFSFNGETPITIFIKEGEEKTIATRIEGDVSSEKIINKLKKNGFIKW